MVYLNRTYIVKDVGFLANMSKVKLKKYGIPRTKKFERSFGDIEYGVKIEYSPVSTKDLSFGVRAKISIYSRPVKSIRSKGGLIPKISDKKKLLSSEEVIITGRGSFEELLEECGENSKIYRGLFKEPFEDLSATLRNAIASEELINSRYSNVCVSYRKPKIKIAGVKKLSSRLSR